MRISNVSPSEIKSKLGSWRHIAQVIIDGLEGKPFCWSNGELEAYRPKAQQMGITLVTKTQIKKLGYRLKNGVKPVGNGYFKAPISRSADLYVLECQAVKDDDNEHTS
jgi:hypothetical protein